MEFFNPNVASEMAHILKNFQDAIEFVFDEIALAESWSTDPDFK